jgi:hypothetical protein
VLLAEESAKASGKVQTVNALKKVATEIKARIEDAARQDRIDSSSSSRGTIMAPGKGTSPASSLRGHDGGAGGGPGIASSAAAAASAGGGGGGGGGGGRSGISGGGGSASEILAGKSGGVLPDVNALKRTVLNTETKLAVNHMVAKKFNSVFDDKKTPSRTTAQAIQNKVGNSNSIINSIQSAEVCVSNLKQRILYTLSIYIHIVYKQSSTCVCVAPCSTHTRLSASALNIFVVRCI